ncbi:hypothetical protein PAAG_11658 [Paracoccidioides lutzii Pb01]|uniref:Uncharacterized protein n=1 Tax=Paracoccidioides lutzii (strain ATCC MYA-826 / Pb01) TaxID=502779 RepID=A0A0A2V1N5_PARBA|nr:hypothetical protein PAAG_11658 [Paracoccidioides lutzii Pb01]KGQ01666.1 hypothetical protein PAAG_11658 [Paracoccidioides lutzii Pb01]
MNEALRQAKENLAVAESNDLGTYWTGSSNSVKIMLSEDSTTQVDGKGQSRGPTGSISSEATRPERSTRNHQRRQGKAHSVLRPISPSKFISKSHSAKQEERRNMIPAIIFITSILMLKSLERGFPILFYPLGPDMDENVDGERALRSKQYLSSILEQSLQVDYASFQDANDATAWKCKSNYQGASQSDYIRDKKPCFIFKRSTSEILT